MSDSILVQISDPAEIFMHALKNLGIDYQSQVLSSTGNLMVTIEDVNETEVQFVFSREGDKCTRLAYWESWKS